MPPRSRGGRDHGFNVSRNPELLGRSIRVGSARVEGSSVVIDLATNGVGHRFPTGDIFRRLTITLTAFDTSGSLIAGDTFHLNRNWDQHRESLQARREETLEDDNRLTAAPREFRIQCARSPARVHLTVEYERGASAEGENFEAFDALEILDTDVALK
jgi:hypothetical protein